MWSLSFRVLTCPSAVSSGEPLTMFLSFSVPSLVPLQLVPLAQSLCLSAASSGCALHSAAFVLCPHLPSPCSPQIVSLARWLSFHILTGPSLYSLQRVSALHSVAFFLCPEKPLPLQSLAHAPHLLQFIEYSPARLQWCVDSIPVDS